MWCLPSVFIHPKFVVSNVQEKKHLLHKKYSTAVTLQSADTITKHIQSIISDWKIIHTFFKVHLSQVGVKEVLVPGLCEFMQSMINQHFPCFHTSWFLSCCNHFYFETLHQSSMLCLKSQSLEGKSQYQTSLKPDMWTVSICTKLSGKKIKA